MPKITSFQWWFANDRNAWQEGAFWNISWIEYRKNVAYLELAKWVTSVYDVASSNWIPVALTLWWNIGLSWRDVVTITNTGKVIDFSWVQSTTPSWDAVNAFEYGGRNFILWQNRLYRLASWSLASYDAWFFTFTVSTQYRPVLNFFWDLLIWNGTSVARVNETSLSPFPWSSTAATEYTAWVSNACIGWLDGTVYAITQVGTNVFVWCNNGSNTNLYIWDWASDNPSQAIRYTDKPVTNVALLWNMHYWWSKKQDYSIRTVNIGESYQPQIYIKTDYPVNPLSTNVFDDRNRLVVHVDNETYLNAIETLNDTVYLPWIGCIYSFWQYFPWVGSYSMGREIIFNGLYVNAMVSGWRTTWGRDFSWMLAFVHKQITGSNYTVAVYNSWQYWENPWVSYRSAVRTITGTATNWSNVILVSNTSNVSASDFTEVHWVWIPEWAYVTSVVANTSVTISSNYTWTTWPVEVTFGKIWKYESMEFIASDMHKWEDDIKITVPCYLPHSSTSIKIYEKRDGWSYSLIKTISYADYPWFQNVEIANQWKWRTKQLKFELITTDSDYSPRLYIWINNQTTPTWNITKN